MADVCLPNGFRGYNDPVSGANIGVTTVDCQNFESVSGGPGSLGPMPDGKYTFGPGEDLAPSEHESMTDGKRPASAHKKFRFTGVGERHAGYQKQSWSQWLRGDKRPLINDPNQTEPRWGINAHCDGRLPGTDGCIGYQDCERAQNAFQSAYDKGNNGFVVETLTREQTERLREQLLGKPASAPWPAVPAKTNTKHGANVIDGEPSVVLGTEQRKAAHVDTPHDKNAKIAEGNGTIRVGLLQKPLAGVGHATTDASQLATGEQSVMMA